MKDDDPKERQIAEQIVKDFFPVSDPMQEAYLVQEIAKAMILYGMERWEDGWDKGKESARHKILDLMNILEPKPVDEKIMNVIKLAAEIVSR